MRDNLPGLGWGDVHLAPKKSLVATACVVEVACRLVKQVSLLSGVVLVAENGRGLPWVQSCEISWLYFLLRKELKPILIAIGTAAAATLAAAAVRWQSGSA